MWQSSMATNLGAWLLLSAAVVVAYWHAPEGRYLNWDDNQYVTHNERVRVGLAWENVRRAFVEPHAFNWHPLTTVSHLCDVTWWNLDPAPPHRENVALHLLNAGLVYYVWRRLTAAAIPAFVVAILFALHPLRVESVAWVSERKDVLCGLAFWLAIDAYSRYVARGSLWWYALTTFWFMVGILAKPMIVTLPVLLLLLDRWPLRRESTVWALVREKLPWFAVAMAGAGLTMWAQSHGAVQALETFPLSWRVGNAVRSIWVYIGQTLWPSDLVCYYPHPALRSNSAGYATRFAGESLAAGAGVVLVTGWAWRRRADWPAVWFGWAWYLVTLAPVIGIIQVGTQAHADRYTYLPMIGPLVAVVFSVADKVGRTAQIGLLAVTVTLSGVGVMLTRAQVAMWRDSATLFTAAQRVWPDSPVVLFNLALDHADQGRQFEAEKLYDRVLELDPRHARALNNQGVILRSRGELTKALAKLRTAVALEPNDFKLRLSLGSALLEAGAALDAAHEFQRAAELMPRSEWVHYHLSCAHLALGQRNLAAADLRRALELRPDWSTAHNDLGAIFWQQQRTADAEVEFEAALAADPLLADAWFNRGILRCHAGQTAQGVADLRRSLQLLPKDDRRRATIEAELLRFAP